MVVTLVLPAAITLATASSQGVIWQGRYQLPLVVGILLMCGLALDRGGSGRLAFDAAVVCTLVVTAAQAWSVVHVRVLEGARTDVLGPDPAWATLHPVLLGTAPASSAGLLAADRCAGLRARRTPRITCRPSRRQRQPPNAWRASIEAAPGTERARGSSSGRAAVRSSGSGQPSRHDSSPRCDELARDPLVVAGLLGEPLARQRP